MKFNPRMIPRGGRGLRLKRGQMNRTESAYAAYLENQMRGDLILWYAFDAVKFRLAENTYYTPDFLVQHTDLSLQVHEVKGTSRGKPFIEDDAAVKIKVAAQLFPMRFKLVWFTNGKWEERSYGYAE